MDFTYILMFMGFFLKSEIPLSKSYGKKKIATSTAIDGMSYLQSENINNQINFLIYDVR